MFFFIVHFFVLRYFKTISFKLLLFFGFEVFKTNARLLFRSLTLTSCYGCWFLFHFKNCKNSDINLHIFQYVLCTLTKCHKNWLCINYSYVRMVMNSLFKSNIITLKKLWNDTNLCLTIIVKKCTLLDCNILEIVYTSQTEYIVKILILMKCYLCGKHYFTWRKFKTGNYC